MYYHIAYFNCKLFIHSFPFMSSLSLTHECGFLWKALLSLIYKHECLSCRANLSIQEDHICARCFDALPLLPAHACPRCAIPRELSLRRNAPCPHCYGKEFHYDTFYSLFELSPAAKAIFHHIKYYNKPWLLNVFSPFLSAQAETLQQQLSCDIMIPIPLSWYRHMQRGFNQSTLISTMLRRIIHRPIKTHVLKRRIGMQQSALRRKERLTNQIGTFMIRDGHAIEGKHVLLIDDIYTTGATVNECARIVRMHAPASISVFTLARTI